MTVHWLPSITSADAAWIDGIPVTAVARTLIDIAGMSALETVEEALDDALRRKLVSLPRLRWRLAELAGRGRPGTRMIRSLLAVRDASMPVPESVFERRLMRILAEAGFPRPILQFPIRDGGRIVARADLAFPSLRLVIEADSYRWHSGRAQWEHDLARRNAITSLGWRMLHVTWKDLTAGREELIRRLRQMIADAPDIDPLHS